MDIGQLLSRFPQVGPPGVPINPADPNQVAMVQAGMAPPPGMPPAMPLDNGAGATGGIPVGAHPGMKGKIGALFADPAFNQALIAAGAQMMQSPQAGQNLGDVFGKSIMTGMNTYTGLKGNAEAKAAQKTKDADASTTAAIARADAQATNADRTKLAKDELGLKERELAAREASDAADRISRENIAKMQESAASKRAGGGTSAIEFAFNEAKKAYVSAGKSETEAQQLATKDVILSQKAPSEQSQKQTRYNRAVDIAMDSWMRNPQTMLENPAGAAQAIHQMAIALADQAETAFAAPGGSPAPQPGGSPPPIPGTPGAPSPFAPPAAGGIPGMPPMAAKPPGRGTQTAPFSAQEAQRAVNALGKPTKVWVTDPATGQARQATVTPDAPRK